MSKIIAEGCNSISIFKLKKWGYLDGNYHSGQITWTNTLDNESNISFAIDLTNKNNMYIELEYKIKDNSGDSEWKNIKQKYPIVTTPCNYGRVRYWFQCLVYNQGVYCGRRVGKLYLGSGSKYFACRHCCNLTYLSRIDGYAYTSLDMKEQEKKIKRWYYNGKPTRKHRTYLKMEKSIEKGLRSFVFRKGFA